MSTGLEHSLCAQLTAAEDRARFAETEIEQLRTELSTFASVIEHLVEHNLAEVKRLRDALLYALDRVEQFAQSMPALDRADLERQLRAALEPSK
jgi:hypothetical protein